MGYLNPQQVDALAREVPGRYSTLIYTLAYGGIRAGEAVALRKRRVNLLRSEISIAESGTEVHGELVFGHGQPPVVASRPVAAPALPSWRSAVKVFRASAPACIFGVVLTAGPRPSVRE